jgi:asparagine synthase (glutamine-hydrolysing)
MCGLFALVNAEGVTEQDEAWASDALQHMYRRGPDSQVMFRTPDGRCVMAHSRLAILDPRSAADQPMVHQETGAAIVYNGEIYNFPELRRALVARGETFETHCDTEVVLRLYVLDGLAGLQTLRGMYAFAIWDPRDRSLVVGRDSFGIKPLYMWSQAGRTVVASQVKALAAGLAEVEGHADALIEFGLFGHVYGAQTAIRGVVEAPPGTVQRINGAGAIQAGAVPVRRLFDGQAEGSSDASEITAAIEESVVAHTLSDVPLGVLLSAGADSAVVASRLALATDPRLVSAFTISFADAGPEVEDEQPVAAEIARRLSFEARSAKVSSSALADALAQYFDCMDQPTVDAMNTFFAARLVNAHGLKVALVGTGGDELFGGYSNFRRAPFLASRGGFAAQIGASMARAAGLKLAFNADKLGWLARQHGSLAGTYLVLRGLMEPEQVARAYDCDAAQARQVFDRVKEQLSEELRGIEGSWSSVSYLETRFYLIPRLLRDSDWTGMAHSVEIRTPLVDWQLWSRVRLLIARRQERHARAKRDLMAPAMGPQISELIPRRKQGFENPYREMETLAAGLGWRPRARLISQQNWAAFVMDRWLQSLAAKPSGRHPVHVAAPAGSAGL